MPTETREIETLANREYKWGFISDIEADAAPMGLNEEIVRFISHKKGEPDWMLQWRLKAYRHWLTMEEPHWAKVHHPPIDYQNTIYYSAPKPKLKSLDEVDPELLATSEKLGIPLKERQILPRAAVDAWFASVAVATTFTANLPSPRLISCSLAQSCRDHLHT